jgi:diphthine-ammonia ligase
VTAGRPPSQAASASAEPQAWPASGPAAVQLRLAASMSSPALPALLDGAAACSQLSSRRVAVSFTGGKDSVLALHRARHAGAHLALLVTFAPSASARFLAHPLPLISAQAASLGLPWVCLPVTEQSASSSSATPSSSSDSWEAGYRAAICSLRQQWGIEALVTGDLLDVAQSFMPRACSSSGVALCRPLWQAQPLQLLQELSDAGFDVIISLASVALCGAELAAALVGSRLQAVLSGPLAEAMQAQGVHSCGEGGEFHTWVLAGPGFSQSLHVAGAQQRSTENGAMVHLHSELCEGSLLQALPPLTPPEEAAASSLS